MSEFCTNYRQDDNQSAADSRETFTVVLLFLPAAPKFL